MTGRVLAAGSEIDSMCTRCKAVYNHTIIAMVGGRVARVKCNTCGSEHNHRPEKPKEETRVRRTTSGVAQAPRPKLRKDAGDMDREEWERLFHTKDTGKAISYDMNGSFKVDDLVDHPVFGFGVVCSRQQGKIEVLFNVGRKLLRCK
ncbi:hypothetical protein [Geotalea sp. SG265]|uniref:hypothetical protein n=1 Tax=Geotalea sp. SG265 TaxID=2922867 RepID=UPI001FAEA6CB|nr:hypothetical protein [Geotalea sp. SG265]